MRERRVRVRLGRDSYSILVGAGALRAGMAELGQHGWGGGVACLIDARVERHHGDRIRGAMETAGLTVGCWQTAAPGERSKNLGLAARLCSGLARAGIARDGLLVCVGGGVVGDLGGLVAALYHRGIACAHVPTTLLAQVDSSVGGKTGVNLPEGKNLVGAFHQPRLVACDPELLATLPRRDVRAGLAEAIKHGVIRDGAYFSAVRAGLDASLRRDPSALAEVVEGSCRIKAEVVSHDEREAGLRAILNFGHTIGHAVESAAGYGRLRHGEAVAVGMIGASRIARELGLCDRSVEAAVVEAVRAAGLPEAAPGLEVGCLETAIQGDKKRAAGRVRWVLPTAIGAVEVTDRVPAGVVRNVLRGLTR